MHIIPNYQLEIKERDGTCYFAFRKLPNAKGFFIQTTDFLLVFYLLNYYLHRIRNYS